MLCPKRRRAAGPVVFWMLTSADCPTGADEASSVALVREMLNSNTEVFTETQPSHEDLFNIIYIV